MVKKFKVDRRRVPKPYRSELEFSLHRDKLKLLPYEPHPVLYDIIKKNNRYTPDFIAQGGNLLIEAKGYFWSNAEAQKYVHLKKNGYNIAFIFQQPDKPLVWAKPKKNGKRTTHREWAESHGFLHCGLDNIPKEWTQP